MKQFRIDYINKYTGEWRQVIFKGLNAKQACQFFKNIYGYRDIISITEVL